MKKYLWLLVVSTIISIISPLPTLAAGNLTDVAKLLDKFVFLNSTDTTKVTYAETTYTPWHNVPPSESYSILQRCYSQKARTTAAGVGFGDSLRDSAAAYVCVDTKWGSDSTTNWWPVCSLQVWNHVSTKPDTVTKWTNLSAYAPSDSAQVRRLGDYFRARVIMIDSMPTFAAAADTNAAGTRTPNTGRKFRLGLSTQIMAR
jgi:hypothetical protein